jgi:hypothetical protein
MSDDKVLLDVCEEKDCLFYSDEKKTANAGVGLREAYIHCMRPSVNHVDGVCQNKSVEGREEDGDE